MTERRRSLTVELVLALGVLGAAVPGGSSAADWQLNPRFVLTGTYDDNFRLDDLPADKIRVSGGSLEASTKLLFEDATSDFYLTPRARSTLYPGHSEEQGTDYFIDTRYSQRWERARYSLTGDFWRQLVLQSFLPTTDVTAGLGTPTNASDIAAITERNRQDFIILTPEGSYDLGPRTRLEAQAQYLDVKYAREILGERENFKNIGGDLGLGVGITPNSTIKVRGLASQFTPEVGLKSHSFGLQSEWTVSQTEVQQAYVRVGVDHTTFDEFQGTPQPGAAVPANPGSANSFSGGVGISRKFRTSDLFVDLMRSVSPNSGGSVVAQDELRLRLEHKFGPRSAAFVGARWIKETSLGSNTQFTDERYVTASTGFEYRLLRQFSVTSQYIYASRKTSTFIDSANSNTISVSLIYEPHRLAEDAPVLGN